MEINTYFLAVKIKQKKQNKIFNNCNIIFFNFSLTGIGLVPNIYAYSSKRVGIKSQTLPAISCLALDNMGKAICANVVQKGTLQNIL